MRLEIGNFKFAMIMHQKRNATSIMSTFGSVILNLDVPPACLFLPCDLEKQSQYTVSIAWKAESSKYYITYFLTRRWLVQAEVKLSSKVNVNWKH